ncbi:MAG: peptide ABC transporter substrate-binding protein, partial [Pseudomonadota bacterium]
MPIKKPNFVNNLSGRFACLLAVLLLAGCGGPWNNPNPQYDDDLVVYQSVISPRPPKHLDPAKSYASDESLFLMQIYEPPMGYHYLKRPYELIPLSVETFPDVTYLDADRSEVEEGSEAIAYTRYTLKVREDEHYQPHPAFALNEEGQPLYLFATAAEGARYKQVPDFPVTGSRPVHANDYAYAIKRLADPELGSP